MWNNIWPSCKEIQRQESCRWVMSCPCCLFVRCYSEESLVFRGMQFANLAAGQLLCCRRHNLLFFSKKGGQFALSSPTFSVVCVKVSRKTRGNTPSLVENIVTVIANHISNYREIFSIFTLFSLIAFHYSMTPSTKQQQTNKMNSIKKYKLISIFDKKLTNKHEIYFSLIQSQSEWSGMGGVYWLYGGGEVVAKGWRRLEEKYFSFKTISHVSHYFHLEKHTHTFSNFSFFPENIWKTECFVGVLLLLLLWGKTVVQIVTIRWNWRGEMNSFGMGWEWREWKL